MPGLTLAIFIFNHLMIVGTVGVMKLSSRYTVIATVTVVLVDCFF